MTTTWCRILVKILCLKFDECINARCGEMCVGQSVSGGSMGILTQGLDDRQASDVETASLLKLLGECPQLLDRLD